MRIRINFLNLAALLILAIVAVGCAGQPDKSSTADNPAKNGLPSIQSKSPGLPEVDGLDAGDIPLCYGPDLKILYVMNYTHPDPEMKVILGDYTLPVDLYRIENGQRTKMAAGIPFITLAQWSPDGQHLGIGGGQQLYILNTDNDSLDSVNELVNLPSAVHFGWSPDGKTVYAEHDAVPNGAVFNVETHKGLPAYKIKEPFPFFKAKLADNLFLGTVVQSVNSQPETVILDGAGQVQKSVARGNFRDADGNSILQVGIENFGLAFYADVNDPKGMVLTNEYIYQCRFLPRGGVIFSTPGETGSELNYKLTVITQKEQRIINVSGPHFHVWPDGRFVDICGYRSERLSLPDLSATQQENRLLYSGDKAKITATVRGAASTYLDNYHRTENLDDQALKQALSRYYIDTRELVEQIAFTDVYEELKSRPLLPHFRAGANHLSGQIDSLIIYGDDRATLVAHFLFRQIFLPSDAGTDSWLPFHSNVSGWGFGAAYEMVKREESWYVTGLSTFPESREKERIAEMVDDFIASVQRGAPAPVREEQSIQFYEQIKGKEIKAGQIQFWNMSEPHRSTSAEQAKIALVYLYAGGERYKLVLSRDLTLDWEIERLSDFSHSGIY